MRSLHLTYLRALVDFITVDGKRPFAGKLFEVRPPVESYEQHAPFAVIGHYSARNTRDGRRYRRLGNGVDEAGKVTARYLRREYIQAFRYRLDFWVKEPAFDILSDPRPQPGADAPPISVDGPGIIDQALFFCSYVRYFTDGTVPVIVTAGPFGTVDDPAGENALYKHYLDIEFRDGLYTIEECPTLDGAIMRMQTIELI